MTTRQKYQEDRQYNDQKTKITGQTIQWPQDKNNRRTDNTMTKRQKYQEDRQYNDQKTKITGRINVNSTTGCHTDYDKVKAVLSDGMLILRQVVTLTMIKLKMS
jgi:hypothetical protein